MTKRPYAIRKIPISQVDASTVLAAIAEPTVVMVYRQPAALLVKTPTSEDDLATLVEWIRRYLDTHHDTNESGS